MFARADVVLAILAVGLVSYACRAGGFFLMRYVRITRGVEVWLQSIPIAIIGAVLGPIAANGGPPEWAGLAVAILVMRFTQNDFASILGAVATVALTRQVL
jgi:uncharacterized membrane protein